MAWAELTDGLLEYRGWLVSEDVVVSLMLPYSNANERRLYGRCTARNMCCVSKFSTSA